MLETDTDYDKRTDKKHDFNDVPIYQNYMIESYYVDCCNGEAQFGKKKKISSTPIPESSQEYLVWGKDENTSNWYEQNANFKGAKKRQLKRTEIMVKENDPRLIL